MARYELMYFPARGRAEQIRVLLAHEGIDFTEVSPGNWLEVKPTTPFRRMPVMTEHRDDGDFVLAESGAIMRHLAREHGLYGSSPTQAAMCDSVRAQPSLETFLAERSRP